MNPTREVIEYYISDIGFEKACEKFHLSQKEADSILIAKVYGESAYYCKNYKVVHEVWIPLSPCTSPDACELFRIIKLNYHDLKNRIVRNKYLLNTRGISSEDIFHNSLLSIMKSAESFIYESDEKTLYFINRAMKRKIINELRDNETASVNLGHVKKIFKEMAKSKSL